MVKAKKLKMESEFKVSQYTKVGEDKTYLEISIPEDIQTILKLFAIGRTVTYKTYGKRHMLKSVLTKHENWEDKFMVFFLEDLLRTKNCKLEFTSSAERDEMSESLSNCKKLMEAMFDLLKKTDSIYKIKVE